MKHNQFCGLAACVLMLAAAMNLQAAATPQSTAFTYQGQLNAGGTLPSGGQVYYFTFTLYNALTGGDVVGAPLQQALPIASGGLFTTDLDFGQIFNGQQYWLEIQVGAAAGTKQPLSARQPINATPVAQYALNSARDFADFFALMPPDNAATVGVGQDIQFPQDGPSSGSVITRVGPSTFNLSAIGTYEVNFQVSVNESGQLILTLNGADLANTVVGRQSGTSQVTGMALVTTTTINSLLTVRNPAGNFSAFTISPMAGGMRPVSAHLVVTRLN